MPGVSSGLAVVGFVFSGLLLAGAAGFAAAQSPISSPNLDITLYIAEPSSAQFFYPGEFGEFSQENSTSVVVFEGVNNLSFDLSDPVVKSSLVQRFDPCECDTPVLVQRIALTTPFYSQRLPLYLWSFAGDTEGFTVEGSAVLVTTIAERADPQIILYADIDSFSARAELVTFWVFFGFASALILVAVGSVGVAHNIRLASRAQSRRSRLDHPVLPLSVGVFSFVVIVIATVLPFAGAVQIGLTIDEPSHLRHLTNFFETGEYSSSVYGPVTALMGHSVNVGLGIEVWGAPLATAEAYQGRHLATAAIGSLGVFAVALTAWLIFGTGRWALVAGAFLASVPLWVGHSMFNLKDIPVATGYTLVTAGLIALFSQRVAGWHKIAIVIATMGLGAIIGAGTRPAALALMLSSAALAALLLLAIRSPRRPTRRSAVVLGVSVTAAAAVFAAIAWFTGRGVGLVAAIERSLDFPWTGFNLYGGERVSERPGLGTLVEVFGAFLPLFILVLLLVGMVFGVARIIRALLGRDQWSVRESAFVLIAVQAFAVLVGVAWFDPVIYDGGRQLLFIFPALALIAVYGLYGIQTVLPYVVSSSRASKRLMLVVVVAGFSVITYDQVRLFPYNYSYYNVIAQGPGINGQWQTDYWGASVREGAQFVAPGDPVMCGQAGSHNFNLPVLPPVCLALAPYVGQGVGAEDSILRPQQYWVIRNDRTLENYGPVISDNCTFHHELTRPVRGEDVVMSRVYICDDI